MSILVYFHTALAIYIYNIINPPLCIYVKNKSFCKSISPIASPVTLCLLGMTWLCPRINVNCLALCSVAPESPSAMEIKH